MDKKELGKPNKKTVKPKSANNTVVSAEDRFVSAKRTKADKQAEAEARARFLSDDEINDDAAKKKTDKNTVEKVDFKTASKKKKKKKKKKKGGGIIIIAVMCLLAFFGLSYALFRINTIEIHGNVVKTDDEIKTLSDIAIGEHMWLFNARNAEAQIAEDPYVQDASVKRVYPDKVEITVIERNAAAYIESVSASAVIDEEGYVLSIHDKPTVDGMLTVTGMGAIGYKVGTYLGDENDFMARTLLSLLDAMTQSGIKDKILVLDISNPMSIEMLTKSGITVHMGQSENALSKLEKLKTVLPWLEQKGYRDGTVDISVQGDPVYSPPSTPTPIPTYTPSPTPDTTPQDTE